MITKRRVVIESLLNPSLRFCSIKPNEVVKEVKAASRIRSFIIMYFDVLVMDYRATLDRDQVFVVAFYYYLLRSGIRQSLSS